MDTVADSVSSAAHARFYVEIGDIGLVTTLRLAGTLDVYSAPILAARIEEALKRRAWNLVLDLADVDRVDPEVTVGTLLWALRRVQKGPGSLVLADASDVVRRPIKARGLALVLLCFTSEADAVGFLTTGLGTP